MQEVLPALSGLAIGLLTHRVSLLALGAATRWRPVSRRRARG